MAGPEVAIPIVTLVAVAAITRLAARRRQRTSAPPRTSSDRLAGLDERISRLALAMDTVAVEIERVGQNQRFITRILTERSAQHRPPHQADAIEGR